MKPYRAGDQFRFEASPGVSFGGRLLLDFEEQAPGRIDRTQSALAWYADSLLVEVYTDLSGGGPPLIPAIFTDHRGFEEERWQIVGHDPVDPETLDFPEHVLLGAGVAFLHKGELHLKLDASPTEARPWSTGDAEIPWEQIHNYCLAATGRGDLVSEEVRGTPAVDLRRLDLRFSPHRPAVIRALGGLDPIPYTPLARSMGFDPARFFADGSR